MPVCTRPTSTDNAYAFGTIDFTGDMPVILGPDGPSLGGFACPATVIEADRWKLGQLAGWRSGSPARRDGRRGAADRLRSGRRRARRKDVGAR